MVAPHNASRWGGKMARLVGIFTPLTPPRFFGGKHWWGKHFASPVPQLPHHHPLIYKGVVVGWGAGCRDDSHTGKIQDKGARL